MLNVGKLTEGFVLDHIQAGRCMDIYQYLGLDKLDCCVAIIKNAKSKRWEKKTLSRLTADLTSWTLIFSDLSTIISL